MFDDRIKEKREFWLALLSDFGIPAGVTLLGFVLTNLFKIAVKDIIISLLFFVMSLVAVYQIKLERKGNSGSFIKRQHFIDKSLRSGDSIIGALLTHFSEDCFNKCSNFSDKCSTCENFSKECNGLLRNYLLEECMNLQNSITMAKKGQYQLSTNIKKFHTIAIDHLIGAKSKIYSVIHWIGHAEANEETYGDLDFHFLNALLTKLIYKTEHDTSKKEKNNFKIRWLLIGDAKFIKNTYDYIFYVIGQLGLDDKAETLFEFHVMSESDYYNSKMGAELVGLSPLLKSLFSTKPNIGIFGSYFMFAESANNNEHGTIYMQDHKDHNPKGCQVLEALTFYDKALARSGSPIPYSSLKKKYDALPEDHRTEVLAARWKFESEK